MNNTTKIYKMKTSYILICVFLSHFIWGQTYQYAPFPQEYGLWHYTEYNDYWVVTGFTEVIYQRDSATGIMGNSINGYYEDNKRVYVISASDTTLKYDFNLTLGDSIIADAAFGTDTFYVVSDDSSSYHGRRQITLMPNSGYYNPTTWVEGIGNISGYGTLWDNFSASSISGGYGFWCMYADSITIPCNSALGQLSSTQNPVFEVYPNPNQGTFLIRSESPSEHIIHVYNSIGQCVFSTLNSSSKPVEIRLQYPKPGIYLIELRSSNTVRIQKFTIY